jgi:hypothetical protein
MRADFPHQWQLALVLWLGLAAACTPSRADECASVQARVLEEVRIVDGFHDHIHDTQAMTLQTQRLRELVAELRGLGIRDTSLRLAVERYHTSVDHLAAVWAEAATVRQRSSADAGTEEVFPSAQLVKLGSMMSAVNDSRGAISEVCGAR